MKTPALSTCGICLMLLLTATLASGATYTVTNTLDIGPGSLRDAMNLANGNPGPDMINFNIPGAGVHTITPLSPLPVLTDQAGVDINALTQPGATTGTNPPSTANLRIELNGANAGPAHGFWIMSSSNFIQGLIINDWEQDGVRIQGTLQHTFNNTVFCNFIGTDPTGTTGQGNGWNQQMLWGGVNIIVTPAAVGYAHDNVVDSNLIGRCYAEGVSISNCPPGDVFMNHVVHNLIGTDVTGLAGLGNLHCGVYIGEGAHDNVVFDNTICDNGFQGVSIVGYAEAVPPIFTNTNFVDNNRIGVGSDGSTALGNMMDGVAIGLYGTSWYRGGHAEYNVVMNNIIARNQRNGVVVLEHWNNNANADRNRITANSIHNNQLLGIDLDDDLVTANDPLDPDSGANQDLNFPVIQTLTYVAGSTTITGNIDIDTNPALALVEVFRAQLDPLGHGEGEVYLGTTTPNAAGNWSITVTGLVTLDWVTATTTDLAFNSSEFAQCVQLIATNQPPVCNAGGPYAGVAGQAIAFNGGGSYDPDGTVVSYAWQFGDGATGAGVTPTHTYATAATYTVSLTVTDNGGLTSTCATTAVVSGLDWADHNVGNCTLTMTDQGILGFMDSGQTQGSGFVFPSGGSNLLFVGSLWVGESTSYVANRDYDDDPAREWACATNPDGHVVVTPNGVSDQDISAAYTDSGAVAPRDLLVRQESMAWASSPDDDYVIVRYVIKNRGQTTLTNLYVGQFLDIDIGTFTTNTGSTDAWRRMAYITGGTQGLHVGAMLLCGDPDPDPVANVTLVDNSVFIHPLGYMSDADKYDFLSAADAQHVLANAPVPEDYSLLVSAGPIALAPGDSNEVAIAIIGGSGLTDLLQNADAAQNRYCAGAGIDDPQPLPVSLTRLLPNAPNPFNPSTTIHFELAERGEVKLAIYDVGGRLVRNVIHELREAGHHALTWNGRDEEGRSASSGIYFLRLDTGARSDSRQVVLMK